MTWSFTAGGTSIVDQVRTLTGDVTQTAKHTLANEDILGLAGTEPNIHFIAADCAESRAARFALDVDVSVPGVSQRIGDRYQKLIDLAQTLRARGRLKMTTTPLAGGVSKSSDNALDKNPDQVPPRWRIGQDDYRYKYTSGYVRQEDDE